MMSSNTSNTSSNSYLSSNILSDKTYLILTKWAYPFGGGEEFMYQTMEWAHNLNMRVYWLCICDSNNKNYTELEIDNHQYGTIIKIPDGFVEKNILNWLKLIKPDIIHHQGHVRRDFYDVCSTLRIPFVSGFHFWHGSIILDPVHLNINILEHYKSHKLDPELTYLMNSKFSYLYTASPFVSDCINKITGINIPDYIYAASSIKKNQVDIYDITKTKYVTIINIHKLKGGEILLYLLKNCPDIPFCCIRTENYSEELDGKIEKMINENKNNILLNRMSDLKSVYQNTRILLAPSLADETFCRTVNEAMMNGIPVVSTGHGNIKYLLGDSGYILDPDNLPIWKETIDNLYNNHDLLKEQSEKTLLSYLNYSEKIAFKQFKKLFTKIMFDSKDRNIMIFTPWCDQGLGIQSRNYARILEKNHYRVSVFALKPYNANTCIDLQKNPEEWIIDNIYYSPHDREKVTDAELIKFVKRYNIGKCLLPETCWFRVFEVAKLMQKLNVKCYAIPNIEIVRKDEVYKHRYFYKILCNNYLCENIFKKYGLTNTEYVGYGVDPIEISFKNKELKKNDEIKILFIGGMNAFSRKHILEICEAVDMIKDYSISLTCTIQRINLLELEDKQQIQKYLVNPKIKIIEDHLTYNDIIDLYHNSHISIQVSKHEGLGIGFYEAVATGTPVLSLDTPPHNEIIKDNINGWLIPCYYKPMTDNKDPIFESAYFDPKVLSNKLIDIISDTDKYHNILNSLIIDYSSRLHINKFTTRFLESIN